MKAETKYSLIIFAVLFVVVLMTKWSGPTKPKTGPSDPGAEKFASDAKQYHFMAKQDQNPILSLLHLCVAATSLKNLTTVVPSDRIALQHNVDMMSMKSEFKTLQTEIVREINTVCPKMTIPENVLSNLIF